MHINNKTSISALATAMGMAVVPIPQFAVQMDIPSSRTINALRILRRVIHVAQLPIVRGRTLRGEGMPCSVNNSLLFK